MQLEEEFLLAQDGVRLLCKRWEASRPKAVCFLVHGLGEHCGRYEGLAERLTQKNFSVWTLDHRGHGRSEGRRGDCGTFSQFVEDLNGLVEKARKQRRGLSRLMVGHSLGGLIALSYAVQYPRRIKGVAVSSPALKMAQEPSPAKWAAAVMLAKISPTASLPNGVNPQLLSHDPEVVKAYQEDPLVHRAITARCAMHLTRAMKESTQLARQLHLPCLVLQAGSDAVCDPKGALEFSQTAGPNVALRQYEGLYHELFNEPQRNWVIEDLIHWMEQVVSS